MAQDTLPKITVKNISNRIIVSWKNNYGLNIANINIQRSLDSLKNFRTIGSVLEPMNKENGFVDDKPTKPDMFYRVFVAFEGGTYIFSKSYRPVKDTVTSVAEVEETVNVPGVKKSGVKLTNPNAPLPIPPAVPPKYVFVPSKFIYTGKDNNVILELENAATNHYSVKFYDEKDNLIFEIKKVTEPFLTIEKVNFKHAGWFYFKLFDNGILKEKNQFYIPREGKIGIPSNELNKQLK